MGNSISPHPGLYTTPSEFLLLWTLVDTLKLERNSKFQVPGSSVIQNKALGPKNDCHNAEMGTTLCQLISIFERWFQPIIAEIGSGKLQKLRNPKILLRKSGEMIFQHFFDESSAVTGFEGPLSRLIFGVKKKQNSRSQR